MKFNRRLNIESDTGSGILVDGRYMGLKFADKKPDSKVDVNNLPLEIQKILAAAGAEPKNYGHNSLAQHQLQPRFFEFQVADCLHQLCCLAFYQQT